MTTQGKRSHWIVRITMIIVATLLLASCSGSEEVLMTEPIGAQADYYPPQ